MGRNRTGITTQEVRRIELSYLLRNRFIEKDKIKYFTLSWTDGSNISVTSFYTKEEQYLELDYTTTNSWTGEEWKSNYKIQLDFIPSNLGKGLVPYFLCPVSNQRCRILYKAYGSRVWKARSSYNNTIFYKSQTSSKYSRYNDEYWRLENEIERLRNEKRWQTHYNGIETRRYKRYKRLVERQREADSLRWDPNNAPKKVREFLLSSGEF